MAKSDSYPDCKNCEFFRWHEESEQHCSKHKFTMPTIDWNMACADWKLQGKSHSLGQMEPGKLYYYSYSTGEMIVAEFASFADLPDPIISVSIRFDHELGWVIYPRRQLQFFPEPDKLVTVFIQGKQHIFQAVSRERKVAAEMIPAGNGEWETEHHTQFVFMLANHESPELLHDWLGTRIDIKRYKAAHSTPSLFAFLEIIRDQRQYVLHFDDLAYAKYSL